MKMNASIENIISKFAMEADVEPPRFNDQARCKIVIRETPIIIEAPADDSRFFLLGVVFEGELSSSISEAVLAGNLYWHETAGATFMWDKQSKLLFLAYQGNADQIDGPKLKNILFNFAERTTFWRENLSQLARSNHGDIS